MRTNLLLLLSAAIACSDNEIVPLQPAISVRPAEVLFEDLVLGEPAETRLQIGNAGQAPLTLDSVTVDAPFFLEWSEGTLDDGDVVSVALHLLPDAEADLEGQVTILSDDPDHPLVRVPVRAAPRAPAIAADPTQLIWPDARTGGEERLLVLNEGRGPLRITGLAVANDGGGIFSLGVDRLPDLMAAGDDAWLDLSALPSDLAQGTLRILSNDPVTPILDVPLLIGADVQECADDIVYAPGTVEIDESCDFAGLAPVWDPIVETAWRAFPSNFRADRAAQASIGRVTDDDGDGDVDGDDPPDLCTVTGAGDTLVATLEGTLRLLSSDGSQEHWSVTGFTWEGQPWIISQSGPCALGDVDGDGSPDVVIATKRPDASAFGIAVFDRDGVLQWMTPMTYPSSAAGAPWRWQIAPAIADLEGDGDVEIVVANTILNGADGSVQGVGGATIGQSILYVNSGPKSFPIDLDGDGQMEVIAGPTFLAPDGSVRCVASVSDGYPAAADLDGDGDGEVVLSGNGEVVLLEDDCSLIRRWSTSDGGFGGPPTLADFDGDGAVEIGIASRYFYFVFETDGSVLWQAPIRDVSSHSTGSSVFDFDGDGAAEVVFADEYDLFVLDGATGRTRFLWTGHASGTGNELPVIADVDDDGSAEIVTCQGGYRDAAAVGCTIVGSASNGWMPARPVWNQHAFSMSHINDDLSIPTDTAPNWPALNTFRSADTLAESRSFDRNARPALVDLCNLDCEEGTQRIVVRVENPGAADLPSGVHLQIRSEIGGTEVIVARGVVENVLAPGETSEGMVFDIDLALMPARSLSIVVDPDGLIDECDEEDNLLVVSASLCPPGAD